MISRAVVRECMSGLASFSNWRFRNQPWVLASSVAFTTMPIPRCPAGVSTTLAPRNRISLRRSTLNVSAIVRFFVVAAKFHLAEDALAPQLLLQHLEGLI